MFSFFRKKKLSIWPNTASASASSLALLIVSRGYPFTSWRKEGIELTEEEIRIIEPACHCFQLYIYKSVYDNFFIGEVMLGSALEISKQECKELVKFLEYGLFMFEETLKICLEDVIKSEDPVNILISRFALMWEMHFCEKENSTDVWAEREIVRKKLYECLWHAREHALNAFSPMVQSINEFDLSSIEQIAFRFKRGLFEDVLKKHFDFPHLYIHKPQPNAQDLLNARIKEFEVSENCETNHQELLTKFRAILSTEKLRFTLMCDGFYEYLDSVDNLRAKLQGVGGIHCFEKLDDITETRNSMFDHMTAVAEEYIGEVGKMTIENLRKNYDDCYGEITKIAFYIQVPLIDPSESPSFALTLDDEEIRSLNGLFSNAQMQKYLSITGIDARLTQKQKEEVNHKLSLL